MRAPTIVLLQTRRIQKAYLWAIGEDIPFPCEYWKSTLGWLEHWDIVKIMWIVMDVARYWASIYRPEDNRQPPYIIESTGTVLTGDVLSELVVSASDSAIPPPFQNQAALRMMTLTTIFAGRFEAKQSGPRRRVR